MQEVRVNVLSRLCTGSGWHAPNQPLAPLPQCLGKALYDTPDWYNDPDSEATSFNGTQLGATCGLFAVNHLLVSAAELGHYEVVLSQGGFEKAAIDDGHAVTPGDAAWICGVAPYLARRTLEVYFWMALLCSQTTL